jgi:hypothetical protein
MEVVDRMTVSVAMAVMKGGEENTFESYQKRKDRFVKENLSRIGQVPLERSVGIVEKLESFFDTINGPAPAFSQPSEDPHKIEVAIGNALVEALADHLRIQCADKLEVGVVRDGKTYKVCIEEVGG